MKGKQDNNSGKMDFRLHLQFQTLNADVLDNSWGGGSSIFLYYHTCMINNISVL